MIFQVVPLTAAVIVTTPQKLAFIDVAKGVRMFSKLKVHCSSIYLVLISCNVSLVAHMNIIIHLIFQVLCL